MSDVDLRELERRWRQTGSASEWIRWARAMARTGEDRPVQMLRASALATGFSRRSTRLHGLRDQQDRLRQSGDDDSEDRARLHRLDQLCQRAQEGLARQFRRARRLAGFLLDRGWLGPDLPVVGSTRTWVRALDLHRTRRTRLMTIGPSPSRVASIMEIELEQAEIARAARAELDRRGLGSPRPHDPETGNVLGFPATGRLLVGNPGTPVAYRRVDREGSEVDRDPHPHRHYLEDGTQDPRDRLVLAGTASSARVGRRVVHWCPICGERIDRWAGLDRHYQTHGWHRCRARGCSGPVPRTLGAHMPGLARCLTHDQGRCQHRDPDGEQCGLEDRHRSVWRATVGGRGFHETTGQILARVQATLQGESRAEDPNWP